MKIGPFSDLFKISPGTARYYINKGLLVPVVKNDRYDFKDIDIDDMRLILKLKSFRFSITDIHKILSLHRLSNFDSPNELNDYIKILKSQKKSIIRERSKVQLILDSLSEEIKKASEKHSPGIKQKKGVSLAFLPYLACPNCQNNLAISHCNIENDQIYSGDLICTCGYKAVIHNGILVGSSGKISAYDWPDKDRNCYRLMNPTLISYMLKAYHWMLEKYNRCHTGDKLILEDYINNYCFCHANIGSMDSNALYIITDKYPEMVSIYKDLIEKKSLDHKILYISSASGLLPLKNGCVDIYIDFDSANEHALYNHNYSLDSIRRYLRKDAYTIGAFFSFKQKSTSIKELHKQFPEAWDKSYDITYFKQYLHNKWNNVIDECSIGNVIDVNTDEVAISYHIPGEVEMDVYFANGIK